MKLPRVPMPQSARGVATACASASALIAAGVFPFMAALYGGSVETRQLILGVGAIAAGGALHYLAACGAVRHRRTRR